MMKTESVVIRADGASHGNPGPAAIGATISNGQGQLITSISQRIGIATNNQAEYQAAITALRQAIMLGAKQVTLCLDSELLVRQIIGQYRVKDATLKQLHQQVKQLTSNLEAFTVIHIPRQQNVAAHNLADKALK